jgi:hypothetical protein
MKINASGGNLQSEGHTTSFEIGMTFALKKQDTINVN